MVNAKIKRETPLINIVKSSFLITDSYLKKIENINKRDINGKNALYWAIIRKNRYNIQILIDNNISLKVSPTVHALSHAIAHNDYGTFVEVYKRKSPSFNLSKNTLLEEAIYFKRERIIYYIVSKIR